MIQKLEMTVLIDNAAGEPLAGEWGLSILIIADGRKILLDTGSSDLFARNADCLGIDLGSVDIGVLSHAHYDHADGMETFFSLNRSAPFLVREGTCENCYGIKEGLLRYIGTGHCTGDHAFSFLKERLGERIVQFSSGFRYFF